MSVPKYIKELTKGQRKIKSILLILIFLILITWTIHLSIFLPEDPLLLFLFPELYFLWATLILFLFFHVRKWKESIYKAENDIYETIAHRSKTSIRNIARIKKLKEKDVMTILQRLIQQEKLMGIIKDGLFIAEKTMSPICPLCNKDIDDRLLMVLCPFCKRAFHKDHIIDFINEMEPNCPNCKQPLTLADIIK